MANEGWSAHEALQEEMGLLGVSGGQEEMCPCDCQMVSCCFEVSGQLWCNCPGTLASGQCSSRGGNPQSPNFSFLRVCPQG